MKEEGWTLLSSYDDAEEMKRKQIKKLKSDFKIKNEIQNIKLKSKIDYDRRKQLGNHIYVKKESGTNIIRSNNPKRTRKTCLNDIVIATVTNITFFGISLKIDGEPLKGVITLTELSNNHKINISEFKYNGKELHVGQELKAKVIGIDDKYGISLSIRQLQSNKSMI